MKNSIIAALVLALTPAALALPTLPNEFETAGNALGPISAFFGGVTSWGTTPSAVTIHSGASLEVWANFVNDAFSVAGFTVGTFGINTPNLAVPAGADTFSLTVQSPTNGSLSCKITLREDDNGDGIIDVNGADDQWESPTFMLTAGTNAYNIPTALFQDLNPGDGNDARNFTTVTRMAYFITFESRDAYPGGQIVGPVSFLIDHVGLFVGPQTIPNPQVPGDVNGDGVVNVGDLLAVIAAWGVASSSPADLNNDGVVNVADLLLVISHWG
jgi:hypothetical protein